MKRLVHTLAFIITFCLGLQAQQYGETQVNNDRTFGQGFITWWRILTGPSDSGNFTHLGIFIDEFNNATQARMALYDHDPADVEPNNLLGSVVINLTNDAYNEVSLSTPVTLAPNTWYWIGVRGNQNMRSGAFTPQNWPYTAKYISSSYNASWPDPAPAAQSSIFNPNNHTVYVVGNAQTLPIKLEAFIATKVDETAVLKWATLSEINNEGWNIQRSTNGFTWETIAWMNGSGNTQERKVYWFTDKNPAAGLNFYRLEQMDYDGSKSYSNHHRLEFKGESLIEVFPNPVRDFVYHRGLERGTVEITNNLGVFITVKEVYENEAIDVADLREGLYYFHFTDGIRNEVFPIIKVE